MKKLALMKFEILTGSGTQDYFTGDFFWYNITLTDSGTTDINATFRVTVRNTTGGTFGQVVAYEEYLKPNDTATLFPNYTRLGKEEYYIYFMDTVGTYTVELTCDKPMFFYRYYEAGSYTVEQNVSHLDIDAMPSYQKLQNDRWNQYIQDSENFMEAVKGYSAQAQVEASNTKLLAKVSVGVAVIAIMLNVIALPKTKLEKHRKSILVIDAALFVVLIIVFFML